MLKKVIGLLVVLMLMVPVIASAHAELVSSNPKNGSTVKGPITSVKITFGEGVKHFNSMTIKDVKGTSYQVKKYVINGENVTIDLAAPLSNGHYTFVWNVLSEDGHVAPGDLQFTVGDQAKTPAQTSTQTTKHAPQNRMVSGLIIILVIVVIYFIYFILRKRK